MPRDRDQLTPEEPADRELLETSRLQGRGGTGDDVLPGEAGRFRRTGGQPGASDSEERPPADEGSPAEEPPPADDERPPGGERGDVSPG